MSSIFRNDVKMKRLRTGLLVAAIILSVTPWMPALADPGDVYDSGCAGIVCQFVGDAEHDLSHNRLTAALEWCNRALGMSPNDIGARIVWGRAEMASGLYDAAQSDFDAAVSAYPEFPGAHVYRGITYLRQHKPQQALIELNKAMAAKTGMGSLLAGNVYVYRGLAFEAVGHESEAVADLTDAMKTTTGDEHDWTIFGFGCYNAAVMGLIETASLYCDESIKRHSRNELAYEARGYLGVKSGQFGQAVTDFTKALYYQDDNTFDLFGRGVAKHALGDRAGGDADIAAATSSEPHIVEIIARLGVFVNPVVQTVKELDT